MSIIAENNKKPKEVLQAGSYLARCYSIVDLWTQHNPLYNTDSRKIRISWELPTELRTFTEEKGEQPLVLSKEFSLSLNEKANLRKFLAWWRGKDLTKEESQSFDITKLLGEPCILSIWLGENKEKEIEYNTINSASPLMKGQECPEQINESFELSLYDDFSWEKFDSLPEFIKEKISKSTEFVDLPSKI